MAIVKLRKWGDSVKIEFRKTECENIKWTELALLSAVLNLHVLLLDS
jgi:hypothetical protein